MASEADRQIGYFRRIWQLRYFWRSLVMTDLRTRYRRSFLGVGWSLVRPVVLALLFCTVFGKIFEQEPAQFAPFLLIGLTLWQFLSESILQGCESFTRSSAYIRQQRLPLAIFPLRTVLGAGFHTLVALSAALVLTVFFKGPPPLLAALAVLPGLVLLFVLAWSLAILAGILRCHFPDVPHLLEVSLQLLMYLTPIVYPLDLLRERGRLCTVVHLNPFTSMVEMVRGPLLTGQLPAPGTILTAVACTGVAALLAAACLRKVERTLVFWV
jgi:ABC-type polysaccharide/polyol phosphate export permease